MVMRDLAGRKDSVRVGLVGAGAMGKGLLYQILMTDGVECVGLAGRRLEAARACAEEFGVPYRIVESPIELTRALAADELPICEDGALVSCADEVEVLVEA